MDQKGLEAFIWSSGQWIPNFQVQCYYGTSVITPLAEEQRNVCSCFSRIPSVWARLTMGCSCAFHSQWLSLPFLPTGVLFLLAVPSKSHSLCVDESLNSYPSSLLSSSSCSSPSRHLPPGTCHCELPPDRPHGKSCDRCWHLTSQSSFPG